MGLGDGLISKPTAHASQRVVPTPHFCQRPGPSHSDMSPPPKCLYETLKIPQTATDAEIKKAYRVAALQNHPDKNPDNPNSEELFKQIQNAYTVLSDPHERAWYDGHRTEILLGRQPGQSQACNASQVDLFTYFSTSVYTGFEGTNGFYEVYGGVFDRLWREEPDRGPAPIFGSSTSEWPSVRDFYREWDAFSSMRSFAMADKWNLAEAPNREVRRAMEKENKRERVRVKKEFNTTVRELVAFVKKRDPRVVKRRKQEEQLRLRDEEIRKERQAERKRERAEENLRMREERDKVLEEDAEGLDQILAGIELDERIERQQRRKDVHDSDEDFEEEDLDTDEEGEDEEDLRQLYCVACRKPFRSIAQKTDHERSKKHRAAVAKLRKELLAEEEALGNVRVDISDATEVGDLVDDTQEEVPVKQYRSKKKRKHKGLQSLQPVYSSGADENGSKISNGTGDDNAKQASDETPGEGSAEVEGEGAIPKEEPEKLSKREKRKLREARRKANGDVNGDVHPHRCNTCGNPFPSRNKLMRHIETSGHALAR